MIARAMQGYAEPAPCPDRAVTPANRQARPLAELAFLQLFHAVKALNTDERPFVLQFVAASRGEGTSAVAAGFAEAAARGASPVLLVDCNPDAALRAASRPARSLFEAFHEANGLHGALALAVEVPGLAVARLSAAEGAFANIDLADLGRLFDMARQAFPIVVLDCPPPCSSPRSLALARYADGTALVVGAGAAPRSVVAATKSDIERCGGQIVGVILNRYRTYIPHWLLRWL